MTEADIRVMFSVLGFKCHGSGFNFFPKQHPQRSVPFS
jgi:hypothetical protein